MVDRATRLGSLIALCLLAGGATPAAEEHPKWTLGKELSCGLAVTVGCDGTVEARILEDLPEWVLLSVGGDVDAADARRARLSGFAGRAVVQPMLGRGIPVFKRAAALLVVDADALGDDAPDEAEIDRVLRPFGAVWVKRGGRWTSRQGRWPDTIADLTHWLGDWRLSSQVPDEEMGRVRSLRWHTGRKHLAGGMVWAAGGVAVAEVELDGERGLAGFDAFTGLQLWHRADIRTTHNYAVTIDHQRLVLRSRPADHKKGKNDDAQSKPVYLRAIDLHTGKDLLIYDGGPDVRGDQHVLANLHDGKLVIAATGSLTVLDAATGKRLWHAEHAGKHVMFPAVDEGRVACVVGPDIGSTAAHGGSLDREILFEAAICYDLATGRQLWQWTQNKLPAAGSSYAAFADGRYWVSIMPPQGDIRRRITKPGSDKSWYLVCIDPGNGETDWIAEHPELGPTDKFLRLFVSGDTLLLCRGAQTFLAMARDTGDLIDGGRRYDSVAGGCTHPRASLRYAYHATTSFEIEPPFWTHRANLQSGRCHKGGYPGLGMLFAAESHCDCDAHLQGLSAFGSDGRPTECESVTVRGPGQPGKELTGDAWRTAMRDANRSTWSPAQLDGELSEVWRIKLDPLADTPAALAAQWERHVFADTVSGPAVADGVLVVALSQLHEVVGLDPANGRVRWRHRADARVDGPVTLAGGVAVYGTAAGWVEAISIDDGRLVWRTLVAPGCRFRVENGQAESSHPVPAPVAVIDRKVYTAAGVHTHVDGGIYFAQLDLTTGGLLQRIAVDGQPQPFTPDENRRGYPGEDVFNRELAREETPGFQKMEGTYPSTELAIGYPEQRIGILTLTPEGWLGLGTLAFDPSGGTIKKGGVDFGYVNTGHWRINLEAAPRYPVHVLAGHLSKDGDQVVMAGVRAKAIAYQGDRLVAIAGTDNDHWRYDPEGSQIALHQVQPDGGTKVLWKVPFAREYDWQRGGWKNSNIAKRICPETLAVARDRALVATVHDGRVKDDGYRIAERARLTVYGLAEGEVLQQLDLPAQAAQAGIAVASGTVYITCLDGSVLCLR
jgi:outer membrane protein assembly factor BamB